MANTGTFEHPPPTTRATKTVELPGGAFRVTQLPPRAAFRVSFRMVRQMGPVLSNLIGGGLLLRDENGEPVVDPKGKTLRVGLVDLVTSAAARQQIASEVTKGLSTMPDADALDLADALVVGAVEVRLQGAWVLLSSTKLVDEFVPDVWTLIALVRASAGLSVLPTLAAGDTGGDSKAAATKAKQAATS